MYIYIYALIFIYSYINVILVIYKKHLAPLFPKHRRFWVSWRSKNPKPNLIALHWQRPWRHGFNLYSTFWTNTYAQRGRLRVVAKKIWVEKNNFCETLHPCTNPKKMCFQRFLFGWKFHTNLWNKTTRRGVMFTIFGAPWLKIIPFATCNHSGQIIGFAFSWWGSFQWRTDGSWVWCLNLY